jgi:molybdate transport system substrate-binding protein
LLFAPGLAAAALVTQAAAQALLAAGAVYVPDPVKATAGIHFMNVLKQRGIDAELGDRLRPHPNGAAAMQALSQAGEPGATGCPQVTEIIFAPGVQLAAVYTPRSAAGPPSRKPPRR